MKASGMSGQIGVDLRTNVAGKRILVFGDLILDRYTWGNAERISPEAPIPVLAADEREVRPGGAASVAASVAALLRGLAAQVAVAGVVGRDVDGRVVRRLIEEADVDQRLVVDDSGRPTTCKERFVGRAAGRHPHQILRVDRESRAPLDRELEQHLGKSIVARLEEFDAVLVSDYDKGVCTARLLSEVIAGARALELPVIVDPARIGDYAKYRHATLLKPNRVEAELATGRQIVTPDDAVDVGSALCETCDARAVVVTLDADGMALVQKDLVQKDLVQKDPVRRGHSGEVVSTRPRAVYDVTGAGDTVLAVLGLAVLGLAQAGGLDLPEAVRLANVAAGLQVQRLGVAPVSWDEIQAELSPARGAEEQKTVTLDEMANLARAYRGAGQTVVFTNGCFDLLHAGHAAYLQEAARRQPEHRLLQLRRADDAQGAPRQRRLAGLGRPQPAAVGRPDRAAVGGDGT